MDSTTPPTKYIGGVAIQTDKEMKERHPADFYPTEKALIRKFYSTAFMGNNKIVADLGAGDGRWGLLLKEKCPDIRLFGTDIRKILNPGFDYWNTGRVGNIYDLPDLMDACSISKFDLIVGNPPFSIAEDWVDICLQNINKIKGMVSLLLPLNWLASEHRYKKYYDFRNNPNINPAYVYVCSTRPSFSENGRTYPSREYAIYCWTFQNGKISDTTELNWLQYDREKNTSNNPT